MITLKNPQTLPAYQAFVDDPSSLPPTVVFRQSTGHARSFAYSYLLEIDFDPSGRITLTFTSGRVHITGRNLRPLFDKLNRHGVVSVQEADETYLLAGNSETVVSAIRFGELLSDKNGITSDAALEGLG
jgi:hypothetical protein